MGSDVGLDLVLPHTVHCWRSTRVVQCIAAQKPALGLVWRLQRLWATRCVGHGVANLVPLIASGAVAPYITGVYTHEQAPEAPRLLEGRLSQGKLALVHPN